MCNVIDVLTPYYNMQYVLIPISSSMLRLKVKATNDAHIALIYGNLKRNPMTELIVGGWGNTKSSVRRNQRKPDKVEVNTPGILDRDEYVGIWVRWNNNYIATGLEGSDTPFMAYKDPCPHFIDHVAVGTSHGATGSWKIEVSPVMFKPITPKPIGRELHWVPMTSNDDIPLGAVIGGFEKGEVLYIARAMHNYVLLPGKYVPSLKHAFVCCDNGTHAKDSFEILCGYNLMWVKMRGDALPPHAFPSGTLIGWNTYELFIGRAFINNDLVPGNINPHSKTCYVPYGNTAVQKKESGFEVLVIPDKIPDQLTWYDVQKRNTIL